MDFQIITFDPNTGVASLGMPAVPRKIFGLEKLTQIVVLSYLRNPGRDVLDPIEGSGLRAAIGQYNISDGAEARALAVQRTKYVESEVIARQKTDEGSPDEKLKKLQVLDVAYDDPTGVTFLRVQIFNEAGDSSDVIV